VVKFDSNPQAPIWFRKLIQDLNRAFQFYGVIPTFDSAQLPDASAYRHNFVYATDLDTYVISDGTDWRPVQLGAPI
jgi:hypothetical protein